MIKSIVIAGILLGSGAEARPGVLMVGDSVFALNRVTRDYIKGAGFRVTDKSRVGAKMGHISSQYTSFSGRPKIVVMNGGGNDILLGYRSQCIRRTNKCKAMTRSVIRKGHQIMKRMERDGVEKLIYVGLHYFRTYNKGLNATVDDGMNQARRACASVSICTFIDGRRILGAKDIKLDDLHPTSTGSRKLGRAIVRELRND